jgi:large subunit ribosomal protein L40
MRRRKPAVLTFDESEARAMLLKQWARYKFRQSVEEMGTISSCIRATERALEELKFESPELYQQAIQVMRCYENTSEIKSRNVKNVKKRRIP